MTRNTGHYIRIGKNNHFIPDPLPPLNPSLDLTGDLAAAYGAAMLALGKLNEVANNLPNQHRFIKSYIIKEALLTSEIEGINTTLLEVLTQPLAQTKPSKETQLVINYTKALKAALNLMQENGLPLVNRILLAAHKALFEAYGGHADPGNFRKVEVSVGNLVPPPGLEVPQLMDKLEAFINIDDSLPPLIKAGLAHVQFETIHPFLDGNGRIGRLLIILIFIDASLLQNPILYPSYYFKKHHADYYAYLDKVRTKGDFEGWILFFLRGIEESSNDAYMRAKDMIHLEKDVANKIQSSEYSRVTEELMLQATKYLYESPVTSINDLSKKLGKSYNSTDAAIKKFIELGILEEMTGYKRNKLYQFKSYIDILDKEYSS